MRLHFYHRRFRGCPHPNYREFSSSTFSGMCIPFSDRLLLISYRLLTHTPAKVSMMRIKAGTILDTVLCSLHPPGGTALVQQFKFPATWRLETSRLGPVMAGLTKSEGRRGSQVGQIARCPSLGQRVSPQPRRGEDSERASVL